MVDGSYGNYPTVGSAGSTAGDEAPATAPITHSSSLAVWDVPAPVEVGSVFTVMVGAKCSEGCSLAGGQVRITDTSGRPCGVFELSRDTYSPTMKLYWAKASLRAPDKVGYYSWEASLDDSHIKGLADTGCAASYKSAIPEHFGFNTVMPAEHEVSIEIIGKDTQKGIGGVRVMMRPYSGYTDDDGKLRLSVAGGEYRLEARVHAYEGHTEAVTVESGTDVCIALEPAEYSEDYRGIAIRINKDNAR